MYAGPRPRPLPSVLQGPDAEAELALRDWAFGDAKEEDAAIAAYEEAEEHAPAVGIARVDRYEPCDVAYARMEQDPREPDEVWL